MRLGYDCPPKMCPLASPFELNRSAAGLYKERGGRPITTRSLRLAAFVALCAGGSAAAWADSVADFYKNKTVTIVVGGAGGGYDIMARLVARYMGGHIPGHPTVIVQNMPGAGGIVEMNYIANIAPQDGTVLASPDNNTPFEPLFGTKQAKYDPAKLNWLGSPNPETSLLMLWHAVPVDTIAEARTHELRMGASGANSTPALYAKLIEQTLGVKMKLIVGYASQNDALLAMERGEIDGYPSASYSSMMVLQPTWIREKTVKILLQIGKAPLKALPDAPFGPDLASNADDKRLIEEASAPLAVGRPYVTGPSVPKDRVESLRQALYATLTDPQFKGRQTSSGSPSTPRWRARKSLISWREPTLLRPATSRDCGKC
jgi:tripartite-type tricarboxylate transporter receptor subunit TctC